MNLLLLLDKIDETAPRSCKTCIHMATHFECDGCLNTPEDYAAMREGRKMPPFRYLHWKPGNWMRAEHKAQLEGRRNVVIGGQGEADFDATSPPHEVSKHLHNVAEQCGYFVSRLHTEREYHVGYGCEVEYDRLSIGTTEGEFELTWINKRLESIRDKNDPDGWSWSRNLGAAEAASS